MNKRAAKVRAEAEQLEREHEEGAPRTYVRPQPPKEPSQVYSIRIPINRLEVLRQLARNRGQAPSALLREWALERLSDEMSPASVGGRFSRPVAIAIGPSTEGGQKPLAGVNQINFSRDFRSLEKDLLTAGAGRESS